MIVDEPRRVFCGKSWFVGEGPGISHSTFHIAFPRQHLPQAASACV